jgi:hypothetical protein
MMGQETTVVTANGQVYWVMEEDMKSKQWAHIMGPLPAAD